MSHRDAPVRIASRKKRTKRVLNICGGRGEEGTFLYSRKISTDRSSIHRYFPHRQANERRTKKKRTEEMHKICNTSYPRFRNIASAFLSEQNKKSRDILTCVVSPSCEIVPSSLPPSLPPTRGELAGPILQYLYFSMLKPRYTINYINKL